MKNNRLVYHLLFPVLLTAFLFSCKKEKDEKDSSTNGLNDLYIYDVNSKTTTNITKTADAMEFSYLFYHKKDKILFSAPEGSYSMNVDGSQKVLWLETDVFMGADLSPDDGTIVYSMNKNLHLANPDGTNKRQLTTDNGGYVYPKWSRDGQKIACVYGGRMYVVTLDGKAEYLSDRNYENWFDWSPDSKELVFSKNGNIFKYNIVDKTETAITSSTQCQTPVFNPVNDKIAFTAFSNYGEGGMDLMLCNADGTGQKSILHRKTIDSPCWSPDGTQIVFVTSDSQSQEYFNVAMCDIGGNNFRIINPIKGFCAQPVWSPDGKYILYNRKVLFFFL